MLARSINRIDPFEPTIVQRIFRRAKRVGTVFAVAAVAISALDLMQINSVANAAKFIQGHRQRVADLSDLIRDGIQRFAPALPSPYAVAMIPRGEFAVPPHPARSTILASADPAPMQLPQITPTPVSLPMSNAAPPDTMAMPRPEGVTSDASPVAERAVARDLNAVEVAMEPPVAAAPAPLSEPAQKLIVLASVDPAPLQLPPSPAALLHLEGNAYAMAERCLAIAIYFEARGEPVSGQIAVAQVVMNRVFSGFYPGDVCAVVYQNANRHRACQFTFACNGKRKIIHERGAWARANRIAKQTLEGKLYVAEVGPATHYHAVYVRPNWVREMHKMARYGIHNFYRPIAWGNGANEPVWGTAALAQANKK